MCDCQHPKILLVHLMCHVRHEVEGVMKLYTAVEYEYWIYLSCKRVAFTQASRRLTLFKERLENSKTKVLFVQERDLA